MGMVAGVVVLYWWWWDGEKEVVLPEFRRGSATGMAAMGGSESSLSLNKRLGRGLGVRQG